MLKKLVGTGARSCVIDVNIRLATPRFCHSGLTFSTVSGANGESEQMDNAEAILTHGQDTVDESNKLLCSNEEIDNELMK